jgi:SAM-dependent methyltransferase
VVRNDAAPRGEGVEAALCPLGCAPLEWDGEILRDHRLGLPHTIRIAWCPECGLGVTTDPPDEAELDHLYRERYLGNGSAEAIDLRARAPRTSRLARVWHLVNGSLPLTDLDLADPILDVGCHTGETLLVLRERGLDAVGLEPNPRAAAVARAHGLPVIEQPVESAALPEAHFGSILLSQVLEHTRDPHVVLRTVRHSLRPGGAVYVIVPNAASAWRRFFGARWVHWHVPFHLFHFTPGALGRLLTQCGLKPRRMRSVTPGEWLLMSLAVSRNARRGVFELEDFSGRYGRRLLVAPLGRLFDAVGRGDAIVAKAMRPQS